MTHSSDTAQQVRNVKTKSMQRHDLAFVHDASELTRADPDIRNGCDFSKRVSVLELNTNWKKYSKPDWKKHKSQTGKSQ